MMKSRVIYFVIIVTMFFSGCGNFKYTPPSINPDLNNSITIEKSKDEIWKQIIPLLGKNFFVINNMDKDSGLINISYSGDPEKYVDCGCITSTVNNIHGERTYNFPASRANQEYETLVGSYSRVNRKMDLEGRMNLIIEEIGPNKCKITANTKYVLTKTIVASSVEGYTSNDTSTINFNSGGSASFPGGTKCIANGKFEQEVLSLLLETTK